MKHLSVFVAFLIIALVNAAGALAYFHLDEKFIGKPTVTKLADSRIHIKFEEKKNQPFPKDAKLPESRPTGGLSLALADTLKNQENYFSFRGEAIMKSHWESFQLEENTDADKTVCHDNGDKNMRMSIYGASSQLVDALKNKKESVILHADANQHICHGNPIFRVVTAAHFFGDEILLVTDVAHYQNLFDEADIALDIKHPDLTHIRSDREIVHPIANDHSAPITSSKSTFGASAVDETEDRFNDKHQENSKTSSTSSSKRVAKAQHFGFHHLVHHISHAVHHVAHSVSHAVSKVTKAVAKGAKKVVNDANKIVAKIGNVVWTLADILQLNFDKNLNPHVTVNKNAAKTLVGVDFTMDLHFTAGFKFQLNIHHGELIIFYTSVYGDLNFGAAAEIPHFDKPSSAQSTLWNIPGGKWYFQLGPLPIWLTYETRCLAAYNLDYNYYAKAAFAVTADAELGVTYQKGTGFQLIANHDFTKTHTLQYNAGLSASPSLAAQARFTLYSFFTGYAQLNMGLNINVGINTPMCSIVKVDVDFFIQISAGLDADLKILGHTLFHRSWGPWQLYEKNWQIENICKNKKAALHAAAASRLAIPSTVDENLLNNRPLLVLTEDDSGKVWSANYPCPESNTPHNDVALTGFFQNNATVLYIKISRNITIPESERSTSVTVNGTTTTFPKAANYTLYFQSALAFVDAGITRGETYNFTIVPATWENAQALGIDYHDLTILSVANGDEVTKPLDLQWLQVSFDLNDMAVVSISNQELCPASSSSSSKTATTLPSNSTAPPPIKEESYFGRMFKAFTHDLYPEFLELVLEGLVAIVAIALIEFALAALAPKIVGKELYPATHRLPRTREWVYFTIALVAGAIATIIFLVGANFTYSEIGGAQVVTPKGENENSTAYEVDAIVWKFYGASIEANRCPIYFSGCPDGSSQPDSNASCNVSVECTTEYYRWYNAEWPACPAGDHGEVYVTKDGRCIKFAWDNIVNSIGFVAFLIAGSVVAMKCCGSIYRRLLTLHACLMLAGMFLNLIWRRMDSFMQEVNTDVFAPADAMIAPFTLWMNPKSQNTWLAACTIFWIVVAFLGIAFVVEMVTFYKESMMDKRTATAKKFTAATAASTAASSSEPEAAYVNADDDDEITPSSSHNIAQESITDASNADFAKYHHAEVEENAISLM